MSDNTHDTNDPQQQRRRADDPRVDLLMCEVDHIKKQMALNTEATLQVRDILASFRVAAQVAKWITAVAGMAAAVLAVAKGWGDFRR